MIKGFKKGLAVVLSAAMVMSCMDTGMTVNAMTDNQIAVVQETDTEAESSTEETAETTKEETSKTEEAETERSKEETEEESKSEEVKSEEATDTVDTEAETETQEETAKTESETETDTAETESETEADTAETESETEAGTATTEEATQTETEEVTTEETDTDIVKYSYRDESSNVGNIYFNKKTGYVLKVDDSLEYIEIPSEIEGVKVVAIGDGAFEDMFLYSVKIPDTVTYIGAKAFANCLGLRTVELTDSITYIGAEAFAGCRDLYEITLPSGIKKINDNTFASCGRLKGSFVIPESVVEIGSGAFDKCFMHKLPNMPSGIKKIGAYAFANNYFTEITLPEELEIIDKNAFDFSYYLEKVYFGENLKFIGSRAFANCDVLKKVYFNGNAPEIEDGEDINEVFTGCSERFTIYYKEGKEGWTTPEWNGYKTKLWIENEKEEDIVEYTDENIVGGSIYFDKKTGYIVSADDEVTNVIIPKEIEGVVVVGIDERAFVNKSNLVSIDIPDTVTHIGKKAFANCTKLKEFDMPDSVTYLGDSAFEWCTGLYTVNLSKNVTVIRDNTFSYCTRLSNRINLHEGITEIGKNAFCSCNIGSIDLPEGLKKIGDNAFESNQIVEIVFPDSLEVLGKNAFARSHRLEKIYFGENLKSIGAMAFSDSPYIRELYFSGNAPSIEPDEEGKKELVNKCSDKFALYYREGKEGWTTPEWNGYETHIWLDKEANDVVEFNDKNIVGGNIYFDIKTGYVISADKEIERVVIPAEIEGVKVVGILDKAFFQCTKLYKIDIPDSVEYIGSGAFKNCRSLYKVSLPQNLSKLDKYLFSCCGNLQEIEIPSNVKEIGESAFGSCDLQKISFPEGLISIGDSAFSSNKSIMYIDIPDSVNYIGKYAFSGIDGLKEVKLSNNIAKINDGTFSSCHSLRNIYLGEKVKEIGEHAFRGCEKLEVIEISECLEKIGMCAFRGTNIKEVIFPESLKEIGTEAFADCAILQRAYFKGDAPKVKHDTFDNDFELVIYFKEGKEGWSYPRWNGRNTEFWKDIELESDKITIMPIKEQVYTGSQIKPELFIYHGKTRLINGIDYTVNYKNNVNAGEATVTINYKGSYTGKDILTFDIFPMHLDLVDIEDVGLAYNGKVQKKLPTLSYNGKTLKKGIDYTVDDPDIGFKEVGDYQVSFSAKNDNFAGSAIGNVRVAEKIKSVKKLKISIDKKSWYYTGCEIQPPVSVYDSFNRLTDWEDYIVEYRNNIDVGKATIIVKGIGDYIGSKALTFNITNEVIKLEDRMVTVDEFVPALKSGCKPEPTVKCYGKYLVKNKDYTVSYSKNKSVGTATVTVKGKGNYKGTVKKTFKITKKDLSTVNMRAQDIIFTGKAGKYVSKPVLTDSDNVQLSSADYGKVTYYMNGKPLGKKDKCEAGAEITVTVEGKGNYEGTASATYKLREGKKFGSAKITVETKSYTGKKIELTKDDIKVTYKNETLIYGKDYEIVENSYKNNIKKGTATVVIRGCGEYVGEKTVSFKIKPMQSR